MVKRARLVGSSAVLAGALVGGCFEEDVPATCTSLDPEPVNVVADTTFTLHLDCGGARLDGVEWHVDIDRHTDPIGPAYRAEPGLVGTELTLTGTAARPIRAGEHLASVMAALSRQDAEVLVEQRWVVTVPATP